MNQTAMSRPKHHARLLRGCFSKAEWNYLQANAGFVGEWEKCSESLDDFEKLLRVAVQVLDEWENSQVRFLLAAWKLSWFIKRSAFN